MSVVAHVAAMQTEVSSKFKCNVCGCIQSRVMVCRSGDTLPYVHPPEGWHWQQTIVDGLVERVPQVWCENCYPKKEVKE